MLARSLCPLLLAASLAAQTPPCIALNDATTNVSNLITLTPLSGPAVLGYRFTSPTALVLQSLEIFTESAFATTSGYMTLEVWDDEPTSNLPGNRLGGGTFQVHQNMGTGWRGANLDTLVVTLPATDYWLVWREPGGARAPYEPGGTTMPVARLSNGVWTAQTAPQALKWRGYCTLLDDANVQAIGSGCATAAGRIPGAFTNHAAQIGNADFQVEASGFPPGSVGVAILGANPAWPSVPVPGAPANCFVHNEALVLLTVPIGTGNERASHAVGAAGHCWLDLAIPSNPALAGFVLDVQFAALDPASTDPLPFVFTNGVRATL